MAFYLRRRSETVGDTMMVCSDQTASEMGSGTSESGSGAFVGSDTVDLADLLAKIQDIETKLNALYPE